MIEVVNVGELLSLIVEKDILLRVKAKELFHGLFLFRLIIK